MLYQAAGRPGFLEQFVVREPALDTDYSSWGERIFSKHDITKIISKSGLIQRKTSLIVKPAVSPKVEEEKMVEIDVAPMKPIY
jgi:hypothetical protein